MTKFPFGKYKDMSVVDVGMVDPGYLTWVSAQENLMERFHKIKEEIDALNGSSDTTPEHNKIQAAFMDEDYALSALSPLLDELSEDAEISSFRSYEELSKLTGRVIPCFPEWDTASRWIYNDQNYHWLPIFNTGGHNLSQYVMGENHVKVATFGIPTEPTYEESLCVVSFEDFCGVKVKWDYTFSIDQDIEILEAVLGTSDPSMKDFSECVGKIVEKPH